MRDMGPILAKQDKLEKQLEIATKALKEVENYRNIHVNTSTKLMSVKRIARSAISEIQEVTNEQRTNRK